MLVIIRVDLNRLAPSESCNQQSDKAYRVQMMCRVQGESSLQFWRRISQPVRDIAMSSLMECQRDENTRQADQCIVNPAGQALTGVKQPVYDHYD